MRLDNRDELLNTFGIESKADVTGDAELILRAWLKWAEDCPDRLLGDFAFAVWDPRHSKLFCARDHFGMRPFYYYHASEQRFVFASCARAILVLPQVPYQINEGRVADFLVPQLEWVDYTSTFFDGVYRLPPGHKLLVTRENLEISEYWKPVPGPELGALSEEEYTEGLLDVLGDAVASRLRAPAGTVGSMLSGGLDSGSVVVTGANFLSASGGRLLPTYSAIRADDAECIESERIRASSRLSHIDPTFIKPADPGDAFEPLLWDLEEPFDGEFIFLKTIFDTARGHGRKVLLDGAGGDVVLLEGSYIVRLLRTGRFRLAISEIVAENRFWNSGLTSEILRYLRSAYVPRLLKDQLRPLKDRTERKSYIWNSLISNGFAERVDIIGRFDRMQETFCGKWEPDYALERCRAIRPAMTAGRERYARIAAAAGMEARDPFLDKRVVDYCSRLPGNLRLQNGWPKAVLRKAMAGKLPDTVVWGRGKPHVGWTFNAALNKLARNCGALDLARLQQDLAGYVDDEKLTRAWRELDVTGHSEQVHSANILSIWLRGASQRPVVSQSPVI